MKYFTLVFDIFLFESIFILLFSGMLFLINDPYFSLFIKVAIVSGIVAVLLGLSGTCFNLLRKDPVFENF